MMFNSELFADESPIVFPQCSQFSVLIDLLTYGCFSSIDITSPEQCFVVFRNGKQLSSLKF